MERVMRTCGVMLEGTRLVLCKKRLEDGVSCEKCEIKQMELETEAFFNPTVKGFELPQNLLNDIDVLIKELEYWPGRLEFIEEAVRQKVQGEQYRLEHLKRQRKDHRKREKSRSFRDVGLDELSPK